jgi:hypothetical protein
MVNGLSATTVRHIHQMDTVGVDDCKWPGTVLRVRALVRGVVPKLENMTHFPERTFLEMRTVPFLCQCIRTTPKHVNADLPE